MDAVAERIDTAGIAALLGSKDSNMTTGTAKELHSLFKPQAKSSAGRVAQRRAVVDAQVAALESCIEDIRRKARETPAWAHGLNSAVTSIELQIATLKANR